MTFKAVIFDLDGTLVNTLSDIAYAVNRTRLYYSLKEKTEEEIKVMIGNGARVLIKRAFSEENVTEDFIDEALAVYKNILDNNLTVRTKVYSGICETLKKLKDENVKIAILSNKDNSHVKGIVKELFPPVFDAVWGYSPTYPHKPDPASLHAIIKELGLSLNEVLYVGDMSVDVVTARNAGLTSVGVLWGYGGEEAFSENKPDFLIQTPEELLNII
ncbi:MAG: HAD family hydrolase [Ruminococcaceae bacterium]|nr:HAD family hydrolase [Oscillospiraceae bacterium]